MLYCIQIIQRYIAINLIFFDKLCIMIRMKYLTVSSLIFSRSFVRSLALSPCNFSSLKIHFPKNFKLCPVISLSFVIYMSSAYKTQTTWARFRACVYLDKSTTNATTFYICYQSVCINLTKKNTVSFSISSKMFFFIPLVTYSHVLHFFKLICYPRRWLSLTSVAQSSYRYIQHIYMYKYIYIYFSQLQSKPK